MNATVTRRTIVVGAALLCAALLLCGCSAKPKPASAPVPPESVVGLWVNVAAKGQPASLSELGFSQDGSFRHSGSNALGLPVTFGGRYVVGSSAAGSVVRLTYDDFPNKPTTWYFRLENNTLTLAPSVADLGTEAAVVLTREKQQ